MENNQIIEPMDTPPIPQGVMDILVTINQMIAERVGISQAAMNPKPGDTAALVAQRVRYGI